MTTQPRIVLIGPPGAGKTTVARELARRWDMVHRDTDDDVAREEGRSVADIFLSAGEEYFRECERAAVFAALRDHDGVLSLGGGAILDPGTQDQLRAFGELGGCVTFLDVSATAAAPRVGFNVARPLLLGNPRARWKELMDQRLPIYTELATLRVLTDDLTPAQVADVIEQESA